MANDFFEKQSASSRIKANIVSEYFPKYCRIINIKGQGEIRYIDLFAGPGLYKDGNVSTPLLVGKQCAEDIVLKDIVHLLFNDNEHIETLKTCFLEKFPQGTFKYAPKFAAKTIGSDEKINTYLSRSWHDESTGKNRFPTLLFVDPFGYKGINTTVLANFMKNWGNEIFLFLNTKRIHAAIENNKFEELMLDFFPSTLTEIKKDRRYKTNVSERLNLIIHNLAKEYQSILGSSLYYTAFKFQEEDSDGTSHFIVHLTKHPRGYELVKQIYYDFDNIGSTLDEFGTYTFDAKKLDKEPTSLFDFSDTNIDLLSSELSRVYQGKSISALNLFNQHQLTTKFSRSHYAQALRKLVENGNIISNYTDNRSHSVSVLIIKECILNFK